MLQPSLPAPRSLISHATAIPPRTQVLDQSWYSHQSLPPSSRQGTKHGNKSWPVTSSTPQAHPQTKTHPQTSQTKPKLTPSGLLLVPPTQCSLLVPPTHRATHGATVLADVWVAPISHVSYCQATARSGCWRRFGFPRSPITCKQAP